MSDYQVSKDGTIFQIKEDGSISRIGKIENGRLGGVQTRTDSGNSSKKWLIFVLGVFAIAALVFGVLFANARSDYEYLAHESYDRITDLEQRISSLESDLTEAQDERDAARRELSSFRDWIGETIPLAITDIEMANTYYDGSIETNYGSTLYSSRSMYFKPRIQYIGFTNGNKTLYIKLYTPSGTLSTGTSSPSGYSYSHSIYIMNGQNSAVLSGWGNRTQGHWPAGTYRIEVWYNGSCLKSKSFNVY